MNTMGKCSGQVALLEERESNKGPGSPSQGDGM